MVGKNQTPSLLTLTRLIFFRSSTLPFFRISISLFFNNFHYLFLTTLFLLLIWQSKCGRIYRITPATPDEFIISHYRFCIFFHRSLYSLLFLYRFFPKHNTTNFFPDFYSEANKIIRREHRTV